MRAILALEDGTYFVGESFTGQGESGGEVIFNTGMTGYQEILTDPSYKHQLVCMTYPHIGNYGVNLEDIESSSVHVAGFIVKECCKKPSNWRSRMSLPEYLKKYNIMGIEGIDTRALTRHIRIHGAMRGYISTMDTDPKNVVEKARGVQKMEGLNLVDQVTTKEVYKWEGKPIPVSLERGEYQWQEDKIRLVVYDFGVKYNILRLLEQEGFEILVVPSFFKADQVKKLNPQGIFLSNGPGDPAAVEYIFDEIETLLQDYPVGGICLGHQILGIVLGGKTYKLKFGHHGVNHPVRRIDAEYVEITSQNHGFCVDVSKVDYLKQTHINLNDQTLEGFVHRRLPVMAVQYHPEASPGPHDSRYFFRDFLDMVKRVS